MRTLGDRSIGLNRTWVKTQDDSCSFSQWEILYFENLQGIYRECVKKLGYLSKSKTINHSTRRSFSSNLSRISQLAMLEERSVAARSSFTAFNRMLGGSPQQLGYNPSQKWINPAYPAYPNYDWGYKPLTKGDKPPSVHSSYALLTTLGYSW